ncbi:MAG: cobaltochelatase subunit CobN [Proteobacteria bacterium]|nr:cobaltochelatase subunit CobN [Pseudomonadota bacterium]MDA1022033.1 cobaltochelatase subunit CobN [Pseudomonadota bacterium]
MHLLASESGTVSDGADAIELHQSPGDIIVLSAADTELASLAQACGKITTPEFPSLRLASLLHLNHDHAIEHYAEDMIDKAKLVIVRVLGGRAYWPFGVDEFSRVCADNSIPVAFLPGDDQPDAELAALSTVSGEAQHRLWQYGVHGGPENALNFLGFAASLIGFEGEWREPRPLVRAGLYWPGFDSPSLQEVQKNWVADAPIAALVFYRALVQSANLKAVDALISGLKDKGVNALPVFAASLKDPVAAATLEGLLSETHPDVILNATGFAVSVPGGARTASPFDAAAKDGAPGPVVLQVVFSGGTEHDWSAGTRGLGPRDIAMNVALPEVDGRILSRAVSFKGSTRRDPLTETDIVEYEPVPDRISFVCDMAANWAGLRRKPVQDRCIAVVLANYPNRDGRIGNGVGLDTPAGTVHVLQALKKAGYTIDDIPVDGEALVGRILSGPTNDFKALGERTVSETISMADYQLYFAGLPRSVQDAVIERWGAPEQDPFFRPGDVDCGAFALSAFRLGKIAVCLQPARGYNIDPKESYHSPDLVPPHNYLAFYAWLRHGFAADAVVHMGKHGNLEWLPGKALALSSGCFPEAALGPLPNIYPFIVNDPGEGTQAKRRIGAVIVDHLTPPLSRAESYGPLRDLEQLVDEYYEAVGVDPRRLEYLSHEIMHLCQQTGLDKDVGIAGGETEIQALNKLDNYLCELKELQIRDGLHIFGQSPQGHLLNDLLVALVRVPCVDGRGGTKSLHRAMAADLNLDFDPLDCVMGDAWTGPKPKVLSDFFEDDRWRTVGDTVERLEALATDLISGDKPCDVAWTETAQVMEFVDTELRDKVEVSGDEEIKGLLSALAGSFVEPGPSGAPTRGRPDVLPTGKNFYSVDTRTVPTPAAWALGWKSAGLLMERHLHDKGAYPRTMALSAWGTSNMRTGGDDIAQALALMGAKPEWDAASRRVTGFEVMPVSVLGRPRVDVTLRVSGFFRDAFPGLIDLFDSAARHVAALDESPEDNPLAARTKEEAERLMAEGADKEDAVRRAGFRVFGSKPGAYGAGLQALIDEKGWQTDDDLARAYVAWGGYAYGAGAEGKAEHGLFENRLRKIEAVLHNQDNREHDLLDSDDYYQFEGGITAAVRSLSGAQPSVYHNDHSRPERPRISTLEEEIARIVRARVVNPKWISGVMRHGYKGAFEMAATVDYMFAFAATAKCVKDHHFDAVFDAYLGDEKVRSFLEDNNPAALKEISERLIEAQERGLWTPRLNSTHATLASLLEASAA